MDTTPPSSLAPPPVAQRFLEPAGFRWGKLTSRHGHALRWGHLPAVGTSQGGAAKTCVLVGGLAEFVEKFFETAQDFANRGFDVWCMDWHGQGASERHPVYPSRPHARDYDRDADDLAQLIDQVTPPGSPRLLVAHSMGGAISTLFLHRHPGKVNAAVLSAPMYELPFGATLHAIVRAAIYFGMAMGRAEHYVPGGGPWRARGDIKNHRSRASHDPERGRLQRHWFEHHSHLRLDAPTYGWVDAALRITARLRDDQLLRSIETPILLGSAGKELFVNPRAHRHAAAMLPNCTLVEFPDAKHELFHEADATRVPWFNAIDAFSAKHFGGGIGNSSRL